MTTELKYDPEFPYAVSSLGEVKAYVRYEDEAEVVAAYYLDAEVIDTTPKPKIPEEANYIFVEDGDQSVFAYRIVGPEGENLWMMVGNGDVTTEELLEYIGDEVVTTMIESPWE